MVCHNEEQAIKDRLDREAIVKSLEDQFKGGAKSLVGNKSYRKYLACQGEKVFVSPITLMKFENKVQAEK